MLAKIHGLVLLKGIQVQSADTSSETCLNISTIGERQSDKVKTEASGIFFLTVLFLSDD